MDKYISANHNRYGDNDEELKEHGTEIDITEPYEKGGFVLQADGKRMVVSTNDTHSLTVGSTGSGKSYSAVAPTGLNIIKSKSKDSLIVIYPKGEYMPWYKKELEKQGYKIIHINIRNENISNHYNPYKRTSEFYTNGDIKAARNKMEDINKQLVKPYLQNVNDAYWENTVTKFYSGSCDIIYQIAKYKAERTAKDDIKNELEKVMDSMSDDEINELNNKLYNEKQATIKDDIKAFLEDYLNLNNVSALCKFIFEKKVNQRMVLRFLEQNGCDIAYNQINDVVENADTTQANQRSMINLPFSTLDNIAHIVGKSDFSIEDLVEKPTCIFIVFPDETSVYNPFVSLMIKSIYSDLIEYASRQPNERLKRTVHFIIDEFGVLPEIADFNNMIAASRSRNIRFHLFLQNYSQLVNTYGKVADSIRNNCANKLFLRTTETEYEDYLQRCVGKTLTPFTFKEVNLVPDGTLRNLQRGKGILLMDGVKEPFKVDLTSIEDYEDFYYSEIKDEIRESTEIKLFDFEKFFATYSKEKISSLISTEEDTKKPTKEEVCERLVNEMKEREKQAKLFVKKKKPIIITPEYFSISRTEFDETIRDIPYGMEKELYNFLLHFVKIDKYELVELVARLYHDSRPFMVRCFNKSQYQKLCKKLEELGIRGTSGGSGFYRHHIFNDED